MLKSPRENLSSFIERARLLTERNIHVVPIRPKEKKCVLEGWPSKATTDLSQWKGISPLCNTGAVAKPDGACFFDADYPGIIERIESETGQKIPRTLTVKSSKPQPLGHYYFRQTDASRALGNQELNLRDASGKDVVDENGKKTRVFDFQQNNKYVVGPGSIHPSGSVYTVVDDSPLVPIPDWLCDWISKVVARPQPAILEARKQSKTSTLSEVAARMMLRDLSENTVEAHRTFSQSMGFAHRHQADEKFAMWLVKYSGFDAEEQRRRFAQLKLHQDRTDQYDAITFEKAYAFLAANKKAGSGYTGDGSDWRDGFDTFGQLTTEMPKFLLSGLIPEKALTFVCAPSYHTKTWFTLQACKAISTGKKLWCFDGPAQPTPVAYHVPEMNAALIRHYMSVLEIENSEMFLVRPMERGIWPLDDPRMLKSSDGRLVVLDTQGFFNPAEDSSNYKDSLNLGDLVFGLLNNGCRGVTALAHPPKYATKTKDEQAWTLENSILGSAGYGGILRSCLRLRNLNPDLNDPNVWIYVQGMKNPGLKPFQLEGIPLEMKVPPGESPYLSALLSSIEGHEDPRYVKACVMFENNVPQRKVQEALRPISVGLVNKWHKKWEESKKKDPEPEQIPF